MLYLMDIMFGQRNILCQNLILATSSLESTLWISIYDYDFDESSKGKFSNTLPSR